MTLVQKPLKDLTDNELELEHQHWLTKLADAGPAAGTAAMEFLKMCESEQRRRAKWQPNEKASSSPPVSGGNTSAGPSEPSGTSTEEQSESSFGQPGQSDERSLIKLWFKSLSLSLDSNIPFPLRDRLLEAHLAAFQLLIHPVRSTR